MSVSNRVYKFWFSSFFSFNIFSASSLECVSSLFSYWIWLPSEFTSIFIGLYRSSPNKFWIYVRGPTSSALLFFFQNFSLFVYVIFWFVKKQGYFLVSFVSFHQYTLQIRVWCILIYRHFKTSNLFLEFFHFFFLILFYIFWFFFLIPWNIF